MNYNGNRGLVVFDYNKSLTGEGNVPPQPEAVEALRIYSRRFPTGKIGIATGRSHKDIISQLKDVGLDRLPQIKFIVGEHGGVIYYLEDGSVVYRVDKDPVRELTYTFVRRMKNRNGYIIEGKETALSVDVRDKSEFLYVEKLLGEIISDGGNLPFRVVTSDNRFVEAVLSSLDDGEGRGKVSALEDAQVNWESMAYFGDGLNDRGPIKRVKVPGCPSNANPRLIEDVKMNPYGIAAPEPEGRGALYFVRELIAMVQ